MENKEIKDNAKVDRYRVILRELKSRLNLDNQKDIAKHYGYNESYFSQIINGVVSDADFIKKLYKEFPDMNIDWLLKGDSNMVTDIKNISAPVQVGGHINANSTIDKALDEIAAQRRINEKLQDKIFELIDKLTEK